MKIESGNILDKTSGIICHQVNSCGVMGAGLALFIKNTYPIVYEEYKEVYDNGDLLLGYTTYSKVSDDLFIANLCAQGLYGYNGMFTDYDAFKKCIVQVKQFSIDGIPVYFPYGIGCGLAGGDWDIVSNMIKEVIPNAVIVKLP